MSRRIVELLFRHKLLLAVPVAAGLALGIVWATTTQTDRYAARAAILVERPSGAYGTSFFTFDPYRSPAENQSDSMRELLRTNAFSEAVLGRCRTPNTQPQDCPLSIFELRANTLVNPGGTHLVFVDFQSASPVQAKNTVTAVLDEDGLVYTTEVRESAEKATAVYEEQLAIAQENLYKATTELNTYRGDHPDLASIDLENVATISITDAEFVQLLSAVESATTTYDRIRNDLAETRIASSGDSNANYRVLDQPEVPASPLQPSTRTLATKPMLGLVGGLFVSSLLFLVLWRLDRTVRLPSDLAFLKTSVPVMVLPELRSKRRWPASFVRLATAISSGLTSL